MSKFQQVMTKEIVDCQTGELITTEIAKTYTTKIEQDSFYMVFIDYVAPMFKLNSDSSKSLLIYFCQHMTYGTNKVLLTAAGKKELLKNLKMSISCFTKSLLKLKELNLVSGEGGDFMINPKIFWKGSMDTRSQLLKDSTLRITFSIE